MYKMPDFTERDEAEVQEFMHAHSFVTLMGVDVQGKPVATHVPVLIKQKDNNIYLEAHIMRNTDHHKAFEHNRNVLVVFNGPHSYVSASWYTKPRQAGTWNYITVHAHGTIEFYNEEGLLRILEETTIKYEGSTTTAGAYNNLSQEYITPLSKAIVAFKIVINKLENVFKLSQNKDAQSYDNIIAQLKTKDHNAQLVAAEMDKRKPKLFS